MQNKNNSWWLAGVVAVVLAIIVWVLFKNTVGGIAGDIGGGKQTIKIGFLMPVSGQFAGVGEGIQKAATMAVEDFEKENPNIDVEVVNEDDGFDVKKGIPAYNKLVSLDKIEGLVMVSTPIIDALYKEMNQEGLPVVSVGLQTAGISNDNIYQMSTSVTAPITQMSQYVEGKNHKSVAVVYNTSIPAIKQFYDVWQRNYTKQYEGFVVNDAQSAKIVASKILAGDFEAVIIFQDAIGGPQLVKNLKTLDTQNKLKYYFDTQLATAWTEYEKLLGDMDKLNGAEYLMLKQEDLTTFKARFKARFGVEPGPFSEYGYDSAMVLLKNYNKDEKTWVENIEDSKVTGYTGTTIFDQDGVNLKPTEMIMVRDGKI